MRTRKIGMILLGGAMMSSFCMAATLTTRERALLVQEAKTLLGAKKYKAAIENLEAAVKPGAKRKNLKQWTVLLGHGYEGIQNYQKSLTVYQEALNLDPKNIDRSLDLARVYQHVELFDQALALYKDVIKKKRKRRDVVLVVADLYYKTNELDLAYENIQKYLVQSL